ncbi:hypothetical protein AY600_08775 [Phormidium willei BDU 130791]|nr:hypothetical protein AY600_08775 [Phormidium willei BDU 130791]
MRVADFVADFVALHSTRTVFMLSGTGSIYLDDAFANHPNLSYLCARHEAAAAVMAMASAKLTGRMGATVVTTGPGGINAIGGISEAWVDSVPVMVISGQVERRHYVPENRSFGLQGFNIVDLVQSITKYATVIHDPKTVRQELERASWHAMNGRPGPVWLDIPLDVQSAEVEPESLIGFEPPLAARMVAGVSSDLEQEVEAVVNLLREAQRPVLIFGQGVRQSGASKHAHRLAKALGAPVLATRLALDLFDYSLPWNMGLGGVRGRPANATIAREADLVVSFGASLGPGFVNEDLDAFADDAKLVVVEIDETEIRKPGMHYHAILRWDVCAVLRSLTDALERQSVRAPASWLSRCEALKSTRRTVGQHDRGDPINSYHFIERLEAYSEPNDIFISDAGSAYYITGQALRFERGQRELTSGTFATMGMTLPLAIGAAATSPNSRILAITGDGSIELNIQELRTLSEHELEVKVFVINNGGYASIRDSQDAFCGGRYTESLEILDFQKVAAAFELPYALIASVTEIDETVASVLTRPGPALIEVVCDRAQQMLIPRPEASVFAVDSDLPLTDANLA